MQNTITEICRYLRNWEFDYDPVKHIGTVTVSDGVIFVNGKEITPLNGQFFRVIGSVFSDGAHIYPDMDMADETFNGAVWLLAIPPEIVALAQDIDTWRGKYESPTSPALSPYNSESFAGYSYSKSTTAFGQSTETATGWQAAFANRLLPWKKL